MIEGEEERAAVAEYLIICNEAEEIGLEIGMHYFEDKEDAKKSVNLFTIQGESIITRQCERLRHVQWFVTGYKAKESAKISDEKDKDLQPVKDMLLSSSAPPTPSVSDIENENVDEASDDDNRSDDLTDHSSQS